MWHVCTVLYESRDCNIHVVSFHFTSMSCTDTFSVNVSDSPLFKWLLNVISVQHLLIIFPSLDFFLFMLSPCISALCWTLVANEIFLIFCICITFYFCGLAFFSGFLFCFVCLALFCMACTYFFLNSDGLHLCFGCFSCSSNINDFLYRKIRCSYFRC